MAWFTCMAGVGGKGNSVIVTCDADFAGIPITCTNGQKTYTKVCPSFSPYEVTFTGLVAGTWTISATVDGVVYSTTAIVTDITAVLSYGFNWKTWVDSSSSLHSSDYTDLADLLSDEAAIRQLFTEHAPTDYAASTATVTPDLATVLNNDLCAKWINLRDYALDTLYANPLIAAAMDSADKYFYGEWGIVDATTTPPTWGAKGNVPVMTSNSAPYGTVTRNAVTQTGGGEAYCAFDGNDTTFWRYPSGTGDYIRYQFTNPVCIKKLYIKNNGTGTTSLSTQKLRVSNDGTTWVPLNDILLNKDGIEVDVNSDNYYLYAEMNLSNYVSSDGSIGITTLQFYGRELSVSVPKMDTNTTPYGEVSASATLSGYDAYKAFNGTNSGEADCWYAQGTRTGYLRYKFTKPCCVKQVTMRNRNYGTTADTAPLTFEIRGSNDNFVNDDNLLGSFTNTNTASNGASSYDVNNDNEYLYYEINVLNTVNAGNLSIGQLQFYGLDYSEKEFEEGTTKKWLYDHGVELVTIVTNTYGSGSSVTKGSQSIYLKNSSSANNSASLNAELDLSPYSLARAKIFNCLASGSVMGSIAVTATTADVNDTRIATINMNTNNGNDYALGLTSINQTYYVAMLCAASAASNPREMEVTEFWLE